MLDRVILTWNLFLNSILAYITYPRPWVDNLTLIAVVIGYIVMIGWAYDLICWMLGKWNDRTPKT